MIITKKIPTGANVTWEASAESYFPQRGSFVMPNTIKKLDIDLEYDRWSEYWVMCNDIRDGHPSASSDKVVAGFTNYQKYAAPVYKSDHTSPMSSFLADHSELRYVQYIDYSAASSISIKGRNLEYVNNITSRNRTETSLCVISISGEKLGTVTAFDASKCKGIQFSDCPLLQTVDVFNMQNVVGAADRANGHGMFENCPSLLHVPEAISEAPLQDCSYMFYNCSSLTNMPQLNTSNCSDFEHMFDGCTGLTSIPQLDGSRLSMGRSAVHSGQYFGLSGCFRVFTGVFGGFKDLGKRLEVASANYKNIVMNIGPNSGAYNWIGNLNAQSIINILNNLYDVSQISGRTTRIEIVGDVWNEIPEEVITSAAAKGWTIQH